MIKHTIRSKDGGTREVSLTPIKAIRFQCLECMGFSAYEIKKCTDKSCPSYPYRLGTNPERKGIGGGFSPK
ncbi:MAG: hypothetical protein HOG49_13575 [Candidatus Scalindua sp.]|mgnify:FL=1|jgi:hypothetical protein|nr:hypothetical protein [Candidatus Scalindua sp.]